MRLYLWFVAAMLALAPVVASAGGSMPDDWLTWLVRWLIQVSGGWYGY